jgi:microcompartment protein CcmK/EutM
MQLGELEGTVYVFDVAQDAAGADRGELLIISDQSDTRTTSDHELHGGVEGDGVGHPGFVDDHQG